VDSTAILQQVQRIRTSLDRVKTMNRKITDVRTNANEIQTEAEALRDEVRASLVVIEDAPGSFARLSLVRLKWEYAAAF
jgi:hypothetical protein